MQPKPLQKHVLKIDDYPFSILKREIDNTQRDIELIRQFLSLNPVAVVDGKEVRLKFTDIPTVGLIDSSIDILKGHNVF